MARMVIMVVVELAEARITIPPYDHAASWLNAVGMLMLVASNWPECIGAVVRPIRNGLFRVPTSFAPPSPLGLPPAPLRVPMGVQQIKMFKSRERQLYPQSEEIKPQTIEGRILEHSVTQNIHQRVFPRRLKSNQKL